MGVGAGKRTRTISEKASKEQPNAGGRDPKGTNVGRPGGKFSARVKRTKTKTKPHIYLHMNASSRWGKTGGRNSLSSARVGGGAAGAGKSGVGEERWRATARVGVEQNRTVFTPGSAAWPEGTAGAFKNPEFLPLFLCVADVQIFACGRAGCLSVVCVFCAFVYTAAQARLPECITPLSERIGHAPSGFSCTTVNATLPRKVKKTRIKVQMFVSV